MMFTKSNLLQLKDLAFKQKLNYEPTDSNENSQINAKQSTRHDETRKIQEKKRRRRTFAFLKQTECSQIGPSTAQRSRLSTKTELQTNRFQRKFTDDSKTEHSTWRNSKNPEKNQNFRISQGNRMQLEIIQRFEVGEMREGFECLEFSYLGI